MATSNQQPNIILIITDHQAFYGHHRPGEFEYQWPRFEAFASEGVRFERAYAVSPVCSAARSSMMTGLYPSAHGIRWNTDSYLSGFYQRDFDSGQRLYSHYLAQAGYRNAYVGKWHCGHERLPIDFGIEGWSLPDYGDVYMSEAYQQYAARRGFGDAHAFIEYNLNHPEWQNETHILHSPSSWTFMNGCGILQGPPEAHEAFFVSQLAQEKLEELSQGTQPFSLVVSFWGPHQPYYPTQPFADSYDATTIPEYPSFQDDLSGRPLRYMIHRELSHRSAEAWSEWSIWQKILARCYGQGLQTDAAIGQVLDKIDALGIRDNTLVIWCADHGDAVASHGGFWDKSSEFTEEVARVPLALRWPAGLDAGICTSHLVSNMDVTATMLAAAGDETEELHSRSLLPLGQANSTSDWPETLICEGHGKGLHLPQRILYWKKYKYVASLFDGSEMYDLEADPFEMKNRIYDPDLATIRDGLRQRVIDHLENAIEKDTRIRNTFLLGLQSGLCG